MNAVPRIILGHPTGNQVFRHLAAGLANAGLLREVCTCIDWRPGYVSTQLLPRRLTAELERRNFSDLGVPVRQHAWREWTRLAMGKLGARFLMRHEKGPFSIDAVYRDFDRWLGLHVAQQDGCDVVYAYEDAAHATFAAATRRGLLKAYDLPIAYWRTSRQLLEHEATRWPEWAPTLVGTEDSAAKLERKSAELEQADIVFCPSRFVAESVPVSSTRRVVVAPFGAPSVPVVGMPRVDPAQQRPLRVLFVGSMTQRKGLADLFAAIRVLNRQDVELIVLGSPIVSMEFYRRQCARFSYEPPRPNDQVLAFMRTCDVLCLPSIVEGRAVVVLEAMSCGLPTIVTDHAGVDDLVDDGCTGFKVPVGAPGAIAERIGWLADNRDLIPQFGSAARSAAARCSWDGYIDVVLNTISSAVEKSGSRS